MGKLFWLITISFLTATAMEAAEVVGKVELVPVKTRRAATHYSGVEMGEIGPPAPMVAVVYLRAGKDEKPAAGKSSASGGGENAIAVMRQEGLQFYPAVLPIQAGTAVSFPNYDNTYHNVFSYSPEKRFDLGRYSKGEESPLVVFDQPGEVRVFCEVHEHMRAVILVLETPYFAATQADGTYIIKDVPPGKYIRKIWQVNKPVQEEEITVEE